MNSASLFQRTISLSQFLLQINRRQLFWQLFYKFPNDIGSVHASQVRIVCRNFDFLHLFTLFKQTQFSPRCYNPGNILQKASFPLRKSLFYFDFDKFPMVSRNALEILELSTVLALLKTNNFYCIICFILHLKHHSTVEF